MNATQGQQGTDQQELWNGRAGCAWVEAQDALDRMFRPFEDLLVQQVPAGSGWSMLDVGCGTGATTLALARRTSPGGRAVGIDISEPMITLARQRAESEGSAASFLVADAQTHIFEPSFDLVTSRFGVMFFSDPVAAFANLKTSLRPGGTLAAIAWRAAAENPFMTTAERAAAPLLPDMPARRPDGPGQFAFADRGKVTSILNESGWAEVDLQPLDIACALPAADIISRIWVREYRAIEVSFNAWGAMIACCSSWSHFSTVSRNRTFENGIGSPARQTSAQSPNRAKHSSHSRLVRK